jgi:hypothetical protein
MKRGMLLALFCLAVSSASAAPKKKDKDTEPIKLEYLTFRDGRVGYPAGWQHTGGWTQSASVDSSFLTHMVFYVGRAWGKDASYKYERYSSDGEPKRWATIHIYCLERGVSSAARLEDRVKSSECDGGRLPPSNKGGFCGKRVGTQTIAGADAPVFLNDTSSDRGKHADDKLFSISAIFTLNDALFDLDLTTPKQYSDDFVPYFEAVAKGIQPAQPAR